jgi:hypothetical protein
VHTNRKRLDDSAALIHERIAGNLQHIMNSMPEGNAGIITTAKAAGVGVGSVQSILKDRYHSPSIRVLNRLVLYFQSQGAQLLGIGDLVDRDITDREIFPKGA